MFAHVKSKMQLVQELNKFASGTKISYPSSLHPEWENITSMMLIYDKEKRPSFVQVLSEFSKVK